MNKEISELKKKNEEKINELNEEIKNLKFQNKELTKELESKDGVIKIMYKDNQNLINQNKLNIIKLEHNSKQIQDLNKILQTKETMINSLKTKDTESDKLFLSKSNSCSYMKLEGSDFLSENITKLLNDNEENKIKLDYLNSKIKNMNPIEKKSDEILDKNSSFGSRVSYKIRSVGNSREKKYDNQTYYESKNTKKNALKKYGIQNNNEIYFIKNKIDLDSSINTKNSYNKSNNNKIIYFSSNSSFKDNNSETKNENYFRKNSYEIKSTKNFNYINNTEYQFDTYKKEKNIKKDLDEKSKNNDIKGDGLKIIEIGKIKRYVSGKFDQKTISTIGFGTFSKELILKNKTKIKFSLIDTAGQENYQALATNYIKNADGVLFVFAHNNKDSFNDIKKWVDNFKDNNPDIDFNNKLPALLIGNKCDLEHEIDEDIIEDLRNENNLYAYIESSAKDDIGVTKIFEEMGELLFKIHGKRKKGQTLKPGTKAKSNKNTCGFCGPDI